MICFQIVYNKKLWINTDNKNKNISEKTSSTKTMTPSSSWTSAKTTKAASTSIPGH